MQERGAGSKNPPFSPLPFLFFLPFPSPSSRVMVEDCPCFCLFFPFSPQRIFPFFPFPYRTLNRNECEARRYSVPFSFSFSSSSFFFFFPSLVLGKANPADKGVYEGWQRRAGLLLPPIFSPLSLPSPPQGGSEVREYDTTENDLHYYVANFPSLLQSASLFFLLPPHLPGKPIRRKEGSTRDSLPSSSLSSSSFLFFPHGAVADMEKNGQTHVSPPSFFLPFPFLLSRPYRPRGKGCQPYFFFFFQFFSFPRSLREEERNDGDGAVLPLSFPSLGFPFFSSLLLLRSEKSHGKSGSVLALPFLLFSFLFLPISGERM